jgi:hypothetical protein
VPKTDASFDPSAYAMVAERIAMFYARHPTGRIVTELIARTDREVTFRAAVFRSIDDAHPSATGWACEREGDGDINTVACLENTETSAIGRALANLGFTASRNRPSREEMEKADRARRRFVARAQPAPMAAARELTAAARPDARPAVLLADVLALVRIAERHGMRPLRGFAIRQSLQSTDPEQLTQTRLAEIERRLRRFIARA